MKPKYLRFDDGIIMISVINAIYTELHNDYPNIRIEYGNTYYEEYIATYKTERERDAAFDEILAAIDGGE